VNFYDRKSGECAGPWDLGRRENRKTRGEDIGAPTGGNLFGRKRSAWAKPVVEERGDPFTCSCELAKRLFAKGKKERLRGKGTWKNSALTRRDMRSTFRSRASMPSMTILRSKGGLR